MTALSFSFSKTIKYIILCKLKNQLKELYGIQSSGWSMLHERFNRYVFCEANRKSLIAEYLMWEEFVEDAKKLGVIYYYGIDLFLKEYKNAVYSCLTGLGGD